MASPRSHSPCNNTVRNPYPSDQDHPDAPLPIEPYRDDESSHLSSLIEYEPRPIDEDENGNENVIAESSRPRHAWQAKFRVFWLKNKGVFLVLLAQAFGASMNVMTQVLEINSSLHPFQVGWIIKSRNQNLCERKKNTKKRAETTISFLINRDSPLQTTSPYRVDTIYTIRPLD